MHVVEKTTVVLTSVHRVHRVLKFTMDFVPCKLHGDDRGDNTVTPRGQPGDNTDTGHSNNDTKQNRAGHGRSSCREALDCLEYDKR